MTYAITVVIPTIPPRAHLLQRAVTSVFRQTIPPRSTIIQADLDREGSAATRNRALAAVQTEWVAFLDDDDEFLPHHLERLTAEAQTTGADVVYPLPRVIGPDGHEIPRRHEWGGGPHFDGLALERQSYINVSSLVRTDLARKVGGFEFHHSSNGLNDDHGFYLRLHHAGAVFAHVHEPTFIWHHHGHGQPGAPGNTSGQPDRW